MDTKYQIRSFVAKIADVNYYNEKQQIIRIMIGDDLYDCKYLGFPIYPNPERYVALVMTCDEFIDKTKGITGDQKNYLPGVTNKNGDLTDIYYGFVLPVPMNQTVAGSTPSAPGAAFAINNANMFDPDKVAIALTPPLNVDYTNKDKVTDFKDYSNGIFINNDGTILIKSGPSSVTMGKEGIYLGGDIHWESSVHNKEWLRDNTLAAFIPLTIVSIPSSMPLIPAIDKFMKFAEGFGKFISLTTKAVKISDIIGK